MHQILTILISMLPVVELKGAIPIAITQYGLPWWQAYIFGVIGAMASVAVILTLLDPVQKWLSKKSAFFRKLFNWIFDYTRRRHAKKLEIYKDLILIIIAAFPIPVLGGVWTASLIAFVFGIKFRWAFALIFVGTLIAGIIFSLGTIGVIHIK